MITPTTRNLTKPRHVKKNLTKYSALHWNLVAKVNNLMISLPDRSIHMTWVKTKAQLKRILKFEIRIRCKNSLSTIKISQDMIVTTISWIAPGRKWSIEYSYLHYYYSWILHGITQYNISPPTPFDQPWILHCLS